MLDPLKKSKVFYLLYFLKKTKRKAFFGHVNFVASKYSRSRTALLADVVKCSLKYGSSFHEYFYYKFYAMGPAQRAAFATAGQMYEYQLKMNPPQHRYYLEDKIEFLKRYHQHVGREWIDLENIDDTAVDAFCAVNPKIVLKNSKGQAGENVEVISVSEMSMPLQKYARKHRFDLAEQFVYQHEDLMRLAPSSLNTIRIITQITDSGEVEYLGATMRVGIGGATDNLSTGGIAIPIDLKKGVLTGPGVSFDITAEDIAVHPQSRITLEGYQLPFWQEVLNISCSAALLYPQNRSVGWDVAIAPYGPLLIEGNHNWGARLWQMPHKQGFKSKIVKYF